MLTALNLANEKAHFDQDKNKSLADFYAFRKKEELEKSCALYALQQHVSDIVMLDMALRLTAYFRTLNSQHGLNAVTASLDRMDLLSFYQEFQTAALNKDRTRMTDVLKRLKAVRAYMNMQGLSDCGPDGEADLSRAVITRAVAPAYPYLLPPSFSFFKPDYN